MKLNERILTIQTLAMPANTNPNGDIFGGWLVSQMDLSGGVLAKRTSRGRITTVAIDSMVFHEPVKVGDIVACYAMLERIGRTSMTIRVDVEAVCHTSGDMRKVTEGIFTYVAIDDHGKPREVVKETL